MRWKLVSLHYPLTSIRFSSFSFCSREVSWDCRKPSAMV